ncbi:cytochrome c biogenesis protein CcdA [Actinomycetes bacterium KLBMP 9797]
MGEAFREAAQNGPILLAIGAAALAGLVSFLSPCVLPLIPGYLSYVTGLSGAELERPLPQRGALSPAGRVAGSSAQNSVPRGLPSGDADGDGDAGGGAGGDAGDAGARRGAFAGVSRVLAGTLLFVAGFTVVFTLTAVLVAQVGSVMLEHRRTLEIVGGLLIIALALAYLGFIPGAEREFRIHKLPHAGLLGAPVFGAVFALSWVPCVGPTLGAVLVMAGTSGQTDRAVVLAIAYCCGLGAPFVAFGVGFRRLLGVFKTVRRNSRWVTRIGAALLIAVGLALLTGAWNTFLIWLQTTVGVGEVGI